MSHLSGFLQAILDDPEDDSARLIFADWLEEQDDPALALRGAFIRLQCRLAAWVPDLEERTRLQEQQRQMLEAHRAEWLGPLADYCGDVRFERGLPRITMAARRFAAPRFGMLAGELLREAWVEQVRVGGRGLQLAVAVTAPALAEVVNLDLGGSELGNGGVSGLLASPHLGRLRRLNLSRNNLTDASARQLTASLLAGQLTWLDLRSNGLSGKGAALLLRSPLGQRLRGLELQGNDLDDAALDAWAGWRRSRTKAPARGRPRRLVNSIGMELALIPAGSFLMGAPESEADSEDDEHPQHPVTIGEPFYLGVYPVTQREYERVMGANPSHFQAARGGGPAHPVEFVSWLDANEFCRRLAALPEEKRHRRVYRLPTEAEWEHAARAGSPPGMVFPFGNTLSSRQANFNGVYPYGDTAREPYLARTSRVGSYPPNPFGLYDMAGNVWEWCSDWYSKEYYVRSPAADPPGPDDGTRRVTRGGAWVSQGRMCRPASRDCYSAGFRYNETGFRVVLLVAP
jgi:uncharacterized protein (TIGR02996 family)